MNNETKLFTKFLVRLGLSVKKDDGGYLFVDEDGMTSGIHHKDIYDIKYYCLENYIFDNLIDPLKKALFSRQEYYVCYNYADFLKACRKTLPHSYDEIMDMLDVFANNSDRVNLDEVCRYFEIS